MNILQVVSHVGGGGDWTVVRTLSRGLIDNGHTVYLNRHQDPRFPSEAIPVDLRLTSGIKAFWRCAVEAAKEKGRDLDVIHAHSPKTLLWARLVAWLSRRPIKVVMSYHWPVGETALRRIIKHFIFKCADRIHCVSSDVRQHLIKTYHLSPKKLHKVVLGVDGELFKPQPENARLALRTQKDVAEQDLILGFIGRLDAEKNIDWLIRFLTGVPEVILLIAGEGPCRADLERLVDQLNLRSRVRFIGRIEDPQNFYNIIDLNCLPSNYEAFPLTVVEAAFCGTPTLRYNVEGASEQIEHAQTGFLFDIEHKESGLHEVLKQILQGHFGDLKSIGMAGRERLIETCSVDVFIDQMEKMYESL